MSLPRAAVMVTLVLACWPSTRACADEAAIIADIETFFATADTKQRVEIAHRIAQDPAYDRAKVGQWLHQADLFKPLQPGRLEIQVPLHDGSSRTVVLRIPKGYDPCRPWPVIYALHGAGGNVAGIISLFQAVLGKNADDYIIAAPDHYSDMVIHEQQWPPTGEHPAALAKIRQTVHVDSDRVFLAGYSMGGHTSWTLAALYPDEFAAALPVAGTFTLIVPDRLWETFLPNMANLPVLGVWGKHDTQDANKQESPDGGIAGNNRRLRALGTERHMPWIMIELPDKGHRDVDPPADAVAELLAHTRTHYPKSVQHTFRHVCQGRAYWIEAHTWAGDQWTDKQRTVQLNEGENLLKDEDLDQAVARHYRQLLAEIGGEINGQEIRIERRKISELTLWIGDGMIDWERPVIVKTGGVTPFEAQLQPDLYICLSQAARTWDFSRLRWAGVRVRPSAGKPYLVTPRTSFPSAFPAPKSKPEPKPKPKRK